MFEHRIKNYTNTIKNMDLLVIYVSLIIASVLSSKSLTYFKIDDDSIFLPASVVFLIVAAAIFFLHQFVANFYYLHSPQSFRKVIAISTPKVLVMALVDAFGLFMAGIWAPLKSIDIYFVMLYAIIYFIVYLSSRVLTFTLFKEMNVSEKNIRNVVIVGANKRAQQFADYVEAHTLLGYHLLGFVDDKEFSYHGKGHLGKMADFGRIIKENVVDAVVISLPIRSFYDTILDLIKQAEEQGIAVNYLTDLFETETVHKAHYQIGPHSAVMMYSSPLEDWRMFCKRIADLLGSSILLLVLAPLFAAVAILIKFTSPGPVLFKQQRIGYNKRLFNIYKFRTMVQGAADLQEQLVHLNRMDGPVFKIENDPRITKIGNWLRKTSIDEFPQLLNVLKGEMSLVGPRPLSMRDYNLLSEDWVRKRFSVMPGCTCLWQISDRHKATFHEWMMLDMEYIEHWGLLSDLIILIKTVPAILMAKGM